VLHARRVRRRLLRQRRPVHALEERVRLARGRPRLCFRACRAAAMERSGCWRRARWPAAQALEGLDCRRLLHARRAQRRRAQRPRPAHGPDETGSHTGVGSAAAPVQRTACMARGACGAQFAAQQGRIGHLVAAARGRHLPHPGASQRRRGLCHGRRRRRRRRALTSCAASAGPAGSGQDRERESRAARQARERRARGGARGRRRALISAAPPAEPSRSSTSHSRRSMRSRAAGGSRTCRARPGVTKENARRSGPGRARRAAAAPAVPGRTSWTRTSLFGRRAQRAAATLVSRPYARTPSHEQAHATVWVRVKGSGRPLHPCTTCSLS